MELTSPLQDATTLLTLAVDARHPGQLDALVREFVQARPPEELVGALVLMARSLCFVTARMTRAVDDLLTDDETMALTDDDVWPAAIAVVRAYAQSAAETSDEIEGS